MRSALSIYRERTELNNDVRIGLRLSEEAAQKLIKLADGERNRSKWLEDVIKKMSDGHQLVDPKYLAAEDLEKLNARLTLIEAHLRRMIEDAQRAE